jgi:DNA-binding transcriptional LysR family regulator
VALFEKRRRAIEVAITRSLINSERNLAICAAIDGIGIARVPAIYVEHTSRAGRSIELLEDRAPRSVGFFLYYPIRGQMSAVHRAVIDVLKAQVRSGLHVGCS